ncbi:MAG: hypothetical protein E6J91_32290 [Deltaproteobacteria bacterium]|nr:MAG: hypothetical protein E6J91_32290 [Deltaproteobacteria bacterium]
MLADALRRSGSTRGCRSRIGAVGRRWRATQRVVDRRVPSYSTSAAPMASRKLKRRTASRSKATGNGAPRISSARTPEIFIASATEDVRVAREVESWVQQAGARARRWDSEFPPGWFTLQRLIEISQQCDGAVVIANGLDKARVRGQTQWLPRGNVLFELGLFISALSVSRTVLLAIKGPHLPSDLNGLTYVAYGQAGDAVARSAVDHWLRDEFFDVAEARRALALRNGKKYSWDDVTRGINYIQLRLEQGGFAPDCVLGLGRSGGIVGGLLASFLGSASIALADLEYFHRPGPGVAYDVDLKASAAALAVLRGKKHVLVVEGATTTGETPRKAAELLKRLFPGIEFRFAVLVQCVASRFVADYYAYVERGTLISAAGHSLLPWHGPKSRTFLAPAADRVAI